jgi:hypothetical protein
MTDLTLDTGYARVDTTGMKTTCTATNKNGKQCKRIGYNWPQLGLVLCPPHAMREMPKR